MPDHRQPLTILRDEFAAAALTGLCSGPYSIADFAAVAQKAYKLADAMMTARDQPDAEQKS